MRGRLRRSRGSGKKQPQARKALALRARGRCPVPDCPCREPVAYEVPPSARLRKLLKRLGSLSLTVGLSVLFTVLAAQALVLDSFMEDFESRTSGASINGVEFWQVGSGSIENALVQTAVTPGGTGKALEISGDVLPVSVARSTAYGGLTPTWVRFLIRPGVGGERREPPSSGIAAVSFDYAGDILVADGTSWVETGKTYSPGDWWEVIYKLNFSAHTYDLYLKPVASTTFEFTPAKSNLQFIDPSRNALESFGVEGAYSTAMEDDTFVDELTVTYIDRLEFTTAAQTLIQEQASALAMTVQLQSGLGESQRAPWDVTVELSSSSTEGEFSLKASPWQAITQIILPKDSTSVTFYYKDQKVGKPTLTVSEFPDQGWQDALQQENVIEAFDHFDVLAYSPQIAGTPFNVEISARDGEGNVNTTYSGTVKLTAKYVDPSTGTMTLTPIDATGFVDGTANISVTYSDAGTIAVTAVDDEESDIQGSSGNIVMLPAQLSLEAASPQTVGAPFALGVLALNAAGAVTPNYRGAVTLGMQAVNPSTDGGTLTPAFVVPAEFQDGVAALQTTYSRWGTIALTATDAAYLGVAGVSGPLTFHPKSIAVEISKPPAGREFFYTQEPFTVKVSALNASGAAIANYQGTVALTAGADLKLPATYTFLPEDAGVHTFDLAPTTGGEFTLQATDTASGIASTPQEIEVVQAYLEVLSTTGAVGGSTEVPILLTDKNGKVITGENKITVSVKLIETNPNGSSSTTNQRVTLTGGKATILLFNSEEESVTVIPTSPYGIQAKSGTVTFGQFSTKGVGFLLWREIREPSSRK